MSEIRDIHFNEGVQENFENKKGKPCFIILDDLLNDVYPEEVCNIFTKGSHHRNISIILITQNHFHQGRYCRDMSLNGKDLVFLKNIRDKNQFPHLARQVHPEGPNKLYKAYLNAITRPHSYLLLDLVQDTDDRLRFQTCILSDEYPPTFYVDVSNEKYTIDLSRPSRPQNSTNEIT